MEKIRIGLMSRVIGLITNENPEFVERSRTHNLCEFLLLEKDGKGNYLVDGKKVNPRKIGKPRKVSYLTFHDIGDYTIRLAMTYLKLNNKDFVDANAVYVHQKFKRIDEDHGILTYQPMFVDLNTNR